MMLTHTERIQMGAAGSVVGLPSLSSLGIAIHGDEEEEKNPPLPNPMSAHVIRIQSALRP